MKTAATTLATLLERHARAGLCISCHRGPREATTPWGQCRGCAYAKADDIEKHWRAFRAGVDVATVKPGDPVTWCDRSGTAQAHALVEAIACDLPHEGEIAVQAAAAVSSRTFRPLDGEGEAYRCGGLRLAAGHIPIGAAVDGDRFIKARGKV